MQAPSKVLPQTQLYTDIARLSNITRSRAFPAAIVNLTSLFAHIIIRRVNLFGLLSADEGLD